MSNVNHERMDTHICDNDNVSVECKWGKSDNSKSQTLHN